MIIACSFILKLVLTLLSFQDVGHMDSEQEEATPQTMESLDTNCVSMDTNVIMGECDENAQEQTIEHKKRMQAEAEDANRNEEENNLKDDKEEEEKMSEGGNDDTKDQSSQNRKTKQTGAEDAKKMEEEDNVKDDKEEEERMSVGENYDTKKQSSENRNRKQPGTEDGKKTEEEDNLKDDKEEEERMSEGESDRTKEQSSDNKKTHQTGTEDAKKTEEEDNLKDDKEGEARMSGGENDDTKEQPSENEKRKQSETEDMKDEEEKHLKVDKDEEEKMSKGEKNDTKEQFIENKKRKQTGAEGAKTKEEGDNFKDDKEEEERMSEGENDDKKKQSSESKKRKQSETEDTKEEEENNLKDDEDFSEEKIFEEIKFPDTLEGFNYKFNSDGQLRDIETDEPFQFVIKPDNHYYNQKRYEALGEILNNYVYDLLELECNLKRIPVPLDTDKDAVEGEPKSFVFASENALTTTGKLMILIHGSGVVRAGQWARRLIINDCLDSGTQIPYIKRAKKEGYEVLVLNTNENEGKDGNDIRGSETPVKHAIYVFQHLLKQKGTSGKHIAIVAHSYGGCVVLSCIEKNLLEKSVFAIAFTDSVHQLQYQLNSPMQQSWLIQRSRNWVSCDKELDEKLPFLTYKKDVDRYSAGTTKHEETSWKAMESIFEYLKTKEPKHLQKNKTVATQNVETKEVNTKEEKHEEQNPKRKKSDKKK